MSQLIAFVLGIVASLFAAAIFPRLQGTAWYLIARWFDWVPFGQRSRIGGTWKVAWHVESERYEPVEIDPAVHIRQLGNRVYAKFRAGKIDCYLRGEIDAGRYVTGTWYDATEGGYHGAFQLIIDPSTREMSGLWIGFSTTGVVKSGKFECTQDRTH